MFSRGGLLLGFLVSNRIIRFCKLMERYDGKAYLGFRIACLSCIKVSPVKGKVPVTIK
jgi:hypothetical protein